MRAKKFVCCLLAMLLFAGVSFISCGNSSKAKADSELTTQDGEDFKSFLDKFTSSAAFQYTRVKFPLKTPITLLADDGETEKTFPFTKEKWPLLDSETMKEERITQEEGGIYVSKFTLNEPKHKIFEAGYEESEVDLRVEFELQADGKWYVVPSPLNYHFPYHFRQTLHTLGCEIWRGKLKNVENLEMSTVGRGIWQEN